MMVVAAVLSDREDAMEFTEHVKVREEKFGTVIFETLKEKVFVTNDTGKEIINLLRKGNSPEEIAVILGGSYAGGSRIENDVNDFILELKKNHILA